MGRVLRRPRCPRVPKVKGKARALVCASLLLGLILAIENYVVDARRNREVLPWHQGAYEDHHGDIEEGRVASGFVGYGHNYPADDEDGGEPVARFDDDDDASGGGAGRRRTRRRRNAARRRRTKRRRLMMTTAEEDEDDDDETAAARGSTRRRGSVARVARVPLQ